MTEDVIRYLFDSTEKYAVSHEIVAEFITAPKKISVKKMIEQNELVAVKDYIVNVNDEYRFTLNAFKYCVINYKLKWVKLFLNVEDDIYNKKIKEYQDTIESLKKQNNVVDKKDTSVNTNIGESVNVVSSVSTEVNTISEDLLKRINSINTILQNISIQLESLPDIEEQVNKISELGNISSKLDRLLHLDVLKNVDNYSKKINSINIL